MHRLLKDQGQHMKWDRGDNIFTATYEGLNLRVVRETGPIGERWVGRIDGVRSCSGPDAAGMRKTLLEMAKAQMRKGS